MGKLLFGSKGICYTEINDFRVIKKTQFKKNVCLETCQMLEKKILKLIEI